MAMDALRNLTQNIPTWQKRLDDLSGQIERRQNELAAVAATETTNGAEVRSLRNTGSTESLKPKDEGPQHPDMDVEPTLLQNGVVTEEPAPQFAKPSPPPHHTQTEKPVNGSTGSPTRPNGQPAAHSRAAAQAKKKHRSASLLSAEGAIPTYRTRSMIIVYYDSYVQNFFDEMVRFVSSSRNLMRKAKMAAKVAHIKRLAEMEVPEDGNASGDDKAGLESLRSLRYMTSRRFGPMGASSLGDQTPDVYANLDKSLESVQMTCEHGAHQFLRDADCNDELKKIQQRMAEVLVLASKEMDRVEREEPELAKDTGEVGKVRTMRPISMRRELSASQKEGILANRDELSKLEAAKPETLKNNIIQSTNSCQVDAAIEADEGIEMDHEMPTLKYRSTRQMRARAA